MAATAAVLGGDWLVFKLMLAAAWTLTDVQASAIALAGTPRQTVKFWCTVDEQCCMQVTDQYNERWRSDWFTADFWHILNFVFLCVLAFLWRPSASATRFAYSALEGTQTSEGFIPARCHAWLKHP